MRLFFATALLACCATMAGGQALPPAAVAPAEAPAPRPALVHVLLTTAAGPITLALEKERAPVTTANFLHYVDSKRLDGMSFYRAMAYGADGGLVQGGVRDPKKVYPPIAHEPTSQTGLRHVDGTLSMARGAPGSAAADFFITLGPIPALDADPALPGDNLGFAAFGHVVEGMDVVRKILSAPIDPALGEGIMKGQMIAEPVRILTARRVQP